MKLAHCAEWSLSPNFICNWIKYLSFHKTNYMCDLKKYLSFPQSLTSSKISHNAGNNWHIPTWFWHNMHYMSIWIWCHLWHTKLQREIDSLKWLPECYAICLSHIPVYKVHCRWTVSGMPRQILCPMLFSNRWRSTCTIYYTIFVVYWDISENLLSKYYRNQCFTLFPKLDYTLFQWMVATFCNYCVATLCWYHTQIAKFMGPTWGPSESCRPQMGPMLAPWATLLSGYLLLRPRAELVPDRQQLPCSLDTCHYDGVIVGVIASQITSLTLFTQPFIPTQIKEDIKAPRHWPLCGESPHKWPVTRKMFPFDDVIMCDVPDAIFCSWCIVLPQTIQNRSGTHVVSCVQRVWTITLNWLRPSGAYMRR